MKFRIISGLSALVMAVVCLAAAMQSLPNQPADFRDAPQNILKELPGDDSTGDDGWPAPAPIPAAPAPAAGGALIDVCVQQEIDQLSQLDQPAPGPDPALPTPAKWQKVPMPGLADDLPLASAIQAFEASAAHWRKRKPENISVAGKEYTSKELAGAFEKLAQILRETPQEPGPMIEKSFDVYQSMRADETGGGDGTGYTPVGHVTSYYSPLFPISATAGDGLVPMYGLPESIPHDPTMPAGSVDVSRCQIYGGALAGQHAELNYWTRPAELESLQTQGSGYGLLPDGPRVFFAYTGKTKRKWHGLCSALARVRTCCMKSGSDCGIPEIKMDANQLREFLEAQPPQRQQQITCMNPSYVFFKIDPAGRPTGAWGLAVTAGRSVAVDRSQVPLGLPGLLSSNKPGPAGSGSAGAAFTRFIATHDVGGAILGGARVDIYAGVGEEAAGIAGKMSMPGQLYILLPK